MLAALLAGDQGLLTQSVLVLDRRRFRNSAYCQFISEFLVLLISVELGAL